MQTGSGLHWATDELRDRIMKVGFEWEEFSAGFKWRDVEAGLRHYCTLYGELPGDDFAVRQKVFTACACRTLWMVIQHDVNSSVVFYLFLCVISVSAYLN